MKYLSVTLIFWLAVWTAPKAFGAGATGLTFRGVVMAWGIYLTWKILQRKPVAPAGD